MGIEDDYLQVRVGTSLEDAEKALIVATLAHCDFHRERAAVMLGISLKTVYNRMRHYGLKVATDRTVTKRLVEFQVVTPTQP